MLIKWDIKPMKERNEREGLVWDMSKERGTIASKHLHVHIYKGTKCCVLKSKRHIYRQLSIDLKIIDV